MQMIYVTDAAPKGKKCRHIRPEALNDRPAMRPNQAKV
jgi:hypothetical protein